MYRSTYRHLVWLLLAASWPVLAAGSGWLAAGEVDLPQLLAPPPAAGSAEQQRDLAAVLELQQSRTPAQVAEARGDGEVSAFRFADVLGTGFSAHRLPKTGALLQASCREAAGLAARAKRHWNRPRPFIVSRQVQPLLPPLNDGSYPSAHAICGYLWGILLADLVPEKRAELFARGIRYGRNRVVAGLHYPSDVEAGQRSAAVLAAALLRTPAFRADLETARSELRAALGLQEPAATTL